MGDSRRIERDAADWLARRDAGPWDAQDRQAFDAWLAERTEHRVALLRLESAWAEAGRLQALAAGLQAGAVPERGQWSAWIAGGQRELPSATEGDVPKPPPDMETVVFSPTRSTAGHAARWRGGLVALSVLVASGVAGWAAWQLGGSEQASYASDIGQLQEVSLADGSRATLSSDSRLEVRMDRGERHVSLARGEAFFEVARDPDRPFVVEAGGHRAVAVGTRFVVRRGADAGLDADPEALRVVVTEGRVRLESEPGPDGRARPSALLPAGSVATAGRHGVLVRTLPLAEAERYLEWREGFLTFDDAPLAQAAAEFNRYNTRRLELADPAVARLRIGGNFRWSNLDGFVGLVEQGFPVRAERHPDRIVLHSR